MIKKSLKINEWLVVAKQVVRVPRPPACEAYFYNGAYSAKAGGQGDN
ncbi:MAG: hypothetical protein U9Q34_01020 [Elusimicrobiota bacterium]|nr:hypothetical protein [Elusimicrobiota bacterium]